MKVFKYLPVLCVVIIFGNIRTLHADTEIDGAAISSTSFTLTGAVIISTLTINSLSVSTITAVSSATITNLTASSLSVSTITAVSSATIANLTASSLSVSTITLASSATITNLMVSSLSGVKLGKILQVVAANTTSATITTNTSYQVTSSSISITPTSSSSKVLIFAYTGYGRVNASTIASGQGGCIYSVFRGGMDLSPGPNGMVVTRGIVASENDSIPVGFWYLDNPATTVATSYTVELHSGETTTTCQLADPNTNSTIILAEVGP